MPLPLVLWIGVKPSSLSGEDGIEVAVSCKNVLSDHKTVDLGVLIATKVRRRLGFYLASGGEKLFAVTSYFRR